MPDLPERTSNFTEEQKTKLIKKEIAKLVKTYKPLGADRLVANRELIENAAFMAITLLDLRKTINQQGVVSVYQNGENQWGTKKSPEVETYNAMVKIFAGITKQLDDALPKVSQEEDDGFDAFVNKRDG